ncbi:hypothetical protein LWI29_002267 [Acer saccharum]|uniref:Uncharacterized protein n=1 Tax=Acer saccharum TaxID=4024 RepID=A0AA39VM97_ACESA|nr:hypothetical protein LWI29_002267 [Acer saccharum]
MESYQTNFTNFTSRNHEFHDQTKTKTIRTRRRRLGMEASDLNAKKLRRRDEERSDLEEKNLGFEMGILNRRGEIRREWELGIFLSGNVAIFFPRGTRFRKGGASTVSLDLLDREALFSFCQLPIKHNFSNKFL